MKNVDLTTVEDSAARAKRVTDQLRGLLKNELAEYGGAEAFMRWVRYDEEPIVPVLTTGKSSNPDYEQVTIYVRKQTRKEAWRKWEDATDGDFSDLIQHLLAKYLSTSA